MKSKIVQLASRDTIDNDLDVVAYVNGSLTIEEEKEFEKNLFENAQLKQKLVDEINFNNQFKDSFAQVPQIEFNYNELDLDKFRPPHSARNRLYKLIGSGALAALLIMTVILFNNEPGNINQNQTFETLSQTTQVDNLTDYNYDIIFSPSLTGSQKQQLLKQLDMTVVSVEYINSLNNEKYRLTTSEQLSNAAFSELKNHKAVMFLEPVRPTLTDGVEK